MIKSVLIILFILLILIICHCIVLTKCKNLYLFKNNKYGGASTSMAMTSATAPVTMSYTISGEKNGLDYSQLRQLLSDAKKYGVAFIEKPVTEKVHISFGTSGDFMINGALYENYTYSPEFFKQKSAIKNVLGNFQSLIDKSTLYNTIKKIMPTALKYLPNSYSNKEFEHKMNHSNMFQNTIYIVKKDNESQQKGVIIITSKQEYYDAKEKLRKLEIARVELKKVKPSYEIIVNEYIINPLLLDGKKMHFRVYYLLSIISGIARCITHDEYRIYIAEEKYKKEDWLNPAIHISGVSGKIKNRRYYWPDDIAESYDIQLITEKMNKFNKIMCIIFTMANMHNYSENYAGYHLYGADIIMTDDFKVYLLEINRRPGFKFAQNEEGWDIASKKFSHRLFSFILNSTSFPALGIKRPPIYDAEFIEKGALSPFGKILTGDNKCFLIPYLDATEAEITAAATAADNCSHINIFLISLSFEKRKDTKKNETFKGVSNDIIGYLVLDNHHYLKIFIIENYRNQGIGTAMIAQFLEIHYMRYYTSLHIPIVKIKKTNTFLDKIAKKLHFHINANHFEYNFLNKI